MKLSRSILKISLLLFVLASCHPKSPKLVPVPDDLYKPTAEESVGEIATPGVDILFVIDDSASMRVHQENLSNNMDVFIEALGASQMDYHVAVTTSDKQEYGGRFYGDTRVVTNKTPNGMRLIKENVAVGTYGSGTEVFFDNISSALSPYMLNGYNSGFYRKNKLLAIVIVTDTDDQGIMSYDALYSELLALKKNPELITTYAVLTKPKSRDCRTQDDLEPGPKIPNFLKISNGTEMSLCDPHYGQKLAEIARDIRAKARMYVNLKQLPDLKTVRVVYGTQIIPQDHNRGWYYNPGNNRIYFGDDIVWSEQPEGTTVQVYFIPADIND